MRRYLNSLSASYLILGTFLVIHVDALNRTVGKAGSPNFAKAVDVCHAHDPENYTWGRCTKLIDCVYEHLGEAFKARLASGTSIAALLPTMLALIGAPPLELVQLALLSPHRALATCCFSIGLPTGLFRQLRPVNRQLSDLNPLEPRVREWTVVLPSLSKKSWHNITAKIGMDLMIIGLSAVMLWRNKLISNWTMVPWRCQSTYLLFIWPFACMGWLVLTLVMLWWFSESIEIYHVNYPSRTYHKWELMLLPYIFDPDRFLPRSNDPMELPIIQRVKSTTVSATDIGIALSEYPTVSSQDQRALLRPTLRRKDSIVSYSGNSLVVRVTMRSVNGIFSWRWFEAIIEAAAFGIYLYATSVLTSLVFLTADEALWHMVAMTVCLSAVRIFTTLF